MNPHSASATSARSLLTSAWKNRQLISQMTRREVVGRYQGSVLGLAWSFFNPMLLLAVYTFVFSVVFKSKWNVGSSESNSEYAIVLFVGLIVHGLFAEVANRSPVMILGNANFVKKVVFPLELLPIIALLAALFHTLVSVMVLLLAVVCFGGELSWSALLFPIILLPFSVFIAGTSWFLASFGVFIRDVGQTVGLLTMVMMFLAPVVYPASAVPERLRPWLLANPLTFIIEQARNVLIWNHAVDWQGWFIYSAAAVVFAWMGYFWFQKTRAGFADVI
jgi:lipopolysaccharide transport system permease protein